MVDVTNKPQIVEHIHKSLTQTVYETKWIPTSARFVLLGSPPRQTGLIQIYRLGQGDIELEAELENALAENEALHRQRVAEAARRRHADAVLREKVQKATHVAKAASAPSKRAILSSNIATVGFPYRA